MGIDRNPKVSVIMGTFNGAKFICRAIDSILNQSYDNLEVIVCDDKSSDGTADMLRQYYKNERKVVVIENEVNAGLSTALNNCLRIATGRFIARMDDDDYAHPNRIERQVRFLQEHPEYAIVGTRINYFDETGVWGQSKTSGIRTKIDIFKGHSFVHPSVMMVAEYLYTIGNYTVSKLNRRGQDYDLWCKFYSAGFRGYVMDEVLLDYYESSASIKRRKLKYRWHMALKMLIWRKRLGLPIFYDVYAWLLLIKGFAPNFVYSFARKLQFKK